MKPETKSKNAADFFNAAGVTILHLFDRWADESAYENIEDYAQPLQPIAERCHVQIVKMTARPFGCKFTTDGRTYQLGINQKSYSYKRIA